MGDLYQYEFINVLSKYLMHNTLRYMVLDTEISINESAILYFISKT